METNNTDIFPSFAVEWELQLLSSDDRCLVNKSMQLLDTLPHAGWYRPEFFQSSIEVHSSICHNLSQLSDNLKKRLEELRSSSKTLGIDLSGGGTHPFDQQLIEFTPLHRYMEMEKKACYRETFIDFLFSYTCKCKIIGRQYIPSQRYHTLSSVIIGLKREFTILSW